MDPCIFITSHAYTNTCTLVQAVNCQGQHARWNLSHAQGAGDKFLGGEPAGVGKIQGKHLLTVQDHMGEGSMKAGKESQSYWLQLETTELPVVQSTLCWTINLGRKCSA